MKPEEIKKLQDDLAAANAAKAKAEADLKKANDTIKEKDTLISQKNDDLVKARKEHTEKFKKLSEMTEEEKAKMSEKEIELQKRQEKLDEDIKALETSRAADATKARNYEVDQAIKRIAGSNKELADTIRKNADSIMGFDKATTPDEIKDFVEKGFNMTGQPRPAGVPEALRQAGNGEAPAEGEKDFASTQQGQEMAKALNLPPLKANPTPTPAPNPNPIPQQ